MKVYAISDLHLSGKVDKPMDIFGGNWTNHLEKIREDWQNKVSDGDIVLIAGDTSWAMTLDDAMFDINSLTDLKGEKVFIRGNHDYWWNGISKIRARLPEHFYMLQNDSVKIGNYIICGSRAWSCPGQPDFKERDEKLYKRETERLKMSLASANKMKCEGDEVICMVHFPPFNAKRENSLFTDVFEKNGVKTVVYGHLHGKDSRTDLLVKKNGINYYLTSCDKLGCALAEIF